MEIHLPDLAVQEVLTDVLRLKTNARLAHQLETLAATNDGAQRITRATVSMASVMLLAKTAMPSTESVFASSAKSQLSWIQPDSVLAELALALLDIEKNTADDVFRDRRLITDALFTERLAVITQTLHR